MFFVKKLGILFLDIGGIFQQYADKVGGGAGAVNFAFKPFFNQSGQVARVVQMRMRQYNRVHFGRFEEK